MSIVFFVLAALMMLYVIVTLVSGGVSMAKTGEGAREKSNDWMWKRVGAQGLALLFLFLGMWARGG